MNTSTLISLLVGIVIPSVVAIVTRASLNEIAKESILILLAAASGIISGLVTNPPASLSQWEHVAWNILAAFVAAEASFLAQQKIGVLNKLHALTDKHFGFGTYDPLLKLAA